MTPPISSSVGSEALSAAEHTTT